MLIIMPRPQHAEALGGRAGSMARRRGGLARAAVPGARRAAVRAPRPGSATMCSGGCSPSRRSRLPRVTRRRSSSRAPRRLRSGRSRRTRRASATIARRARRAHASRTRLLRALDAGRLSLRAGGDGAGRRGAARRHHRRLAAGRRSAAAHRAVWRRRREHPHVRSCHAAVGRHARGRAHRAGARD